MYIIKNREKTFCGPSAFAGVLFDDYEDELNQVQNTVEESAHE